MSIAKPDRLLIADDDPNLLAAYVLFFEAYGYEIRTAGDGADALAEYGAWQPRIVVLDIQMPRLDGWAVARAIRKLKAGVVPLLVAVSALAAPADLAQSIKSGFDHHFVKPAELPVILAAIVGRAGNSGVEPS
jgi:CheY-like chemotaxis protein